MSFADLPQLAPDAAPQPQGEPYSNEWSGYLTEENYRHVAARMRELFSGRALAITTVYEYRGYEPEVRAPVWFTNVRHLNRDGHFLHYADGVNEHDYGEGHVSIGFSDDAWSYSISTSSWNRMRRQPGWWFGIDDELRRSEDRILPRTLPDATLVAGNPRERASKVLRFIDEVEAAYWTPTVKFERKTMIVHNRAPDGREFYLTVTALEGDVVVLGRFAAASAWRGLQKRVREEGLPDVDTLSTRAHIEDVFGGAHNVEKWL